MKQLIHKFIFSLIFVSVSVFGALMYELANPLVANAAELVRSSVGDASRHISLSDYADYKTSVAWPSSSTCSPSRSSPATKPIPWQPANAGTGSSQTFDGDSLFQNGDCTTRYTDSGRGSGVWLPASTFSWGTDGSTFSSSASAVDGASNSSSCPAGVSRIWPNGGDNSEHSDSLYAANGNSGYAPTTFGLYSHGAALFKKTFNISGTPSNAELVISGDDFYRVYVNGTLITTQSSVNSSSTITSAALNSALRSGTNHISIMVIDKALWLTSATQAPRGKGVCYSLNADVGTSTYPGNYSNTSTSSPSCTPSLQPRAVNEYATLDATGGDGSYSWSTTSDGNPQNGLGGSFSTYYSSSGTKIVTVTSGGVSATCTVEVTASAPVCQSFTASPSVIAAGQTTTLSWNITNSPTTTSISPAPGNVSPPDSGSTTVTPTSNTTYTLTATNGGGSVSCPAAVSIVSRPYLRVFGGDVQVGTSLVAGCPAILPNNAKILTFNLGSGGSWQGAGTQMAAFALGNISGFPSSNASSGGKRLSFSNRVGIGDADYGGAFGKTICAPDYWASATSPAPLFNIASAGYTVAEGTKPVIYVDGNAVIEGNIVYANSNSWSKLSLIPSYTLVVRGNIYIGNNVTQMDGTFIALPNPAGGGGTIYTCSSGSTPYGGGGTYTASFCNTTLTVNGSFIAEDIRFTRTRGTLNSPDIAEIFRFGPEVWAQ